jgi:outer membrane protein assembly factor BamB
VAGGSVIVTHYNCFSNPAETSVQAVSLSSGQPEWQRNGNWTAINSDSATSPAAQVYAKNPNGHDVALSSQTGRRMYRIPTGHDIIAADGHRVYAVCGSKLQHVCGFAATNGTKLWRVDVPPTPPDDYYIPPHGIVGADVFYLGDGRVLNAATGQLIIKLPGAPSSVGRGRLAVGTGAGIALYGLPSS